MKIRNVILTMAIAVLSAFSFTAAAQDTEVEIGDDQLYRYAVMQEVVHLMKKDISSEVNKMIKAQEGMTGQRYKDLAATKGDEDQIGRKKRKGLGN